MKNIFKYVLSFVALALVIVSCDEDETTFNALEYPADAFIAFDKGTAEVSEGSSDEIIVNISFGTVNQTSDVTIDFTITSEDMVEGTHYEIVDNKSQFSIASGEYTDNIIIKLIDNADKEEDKELTVTLTSNSTGAKLGYPGPDSLNSTFVLSVLDDDCEKEESLRPFEGTWGGTDECGDVASQTITELACGTGITIRGLAYGWMAGYWGEVIMTEHPVFISIDETNGTIDIPSQLYLTTTWNGDVQPNYNLVGSGTIDTSGATPVMHIEYDLVQGGNSMAGVGGTSCGAFYVADIVLE